MPRHKLISFDIVSLFTMIPLDETIVVILDQLYPEPCACPASSKLVKKSDQCLTCNNKDHMRWLIETATSHTHFHFNNKIYSQVSGVSMGSPLGPLLADLFLTHLEKKFLNDLRNYGVVFYKRYVDDIFAIIKEETDITQLKTLLNSYHPSIQLTAELENEKSLPFLDILINRRSSIAQSWFNTSVYRKPTFTELMLKWKSFIPFEHKKSAVSSLVYRAIRICSNYTLLHKEFFFIRQLTVSNGYPLSFTQNIIRTTLDRYLSRSKTSLSTNNSSLEAPINAPVPNSKISDGT